MEGCPSPAASGQNADERRPDRLVIGAEVRLVIGTPSHVQTRLRTVEALVKLHAHLPAVFKQAKPLFSGQSVYSM